MLQSLGVPGAIVLIKEVTVKRLARVAALHVPLTAPDRSPLCENRGVSASRQDDNLPGVTWEGTTIRSATPRLDLAQGQVPEF